jgi:uncharacterized damage-inducible protein DinB
VEQDFIRSILGYDAWANDLLLDLVEKLPPAQLTASFPGSSYDSIRDTVAHILQGEYAYSFRWLYAERPTPAPAGASIAELRQRFRRHDQAVEAYLASLRPEDLATAYDMKRGDVSFSISMWQLMLSVADHGIHHRSELADMLTRAGSPPPVMDFPDYLASVHLRQP